MQYPLRNKKIHGITAIVLFLITSLVLLFFAQHESPAEKAFRELAGVPKKTPWSLYLAMIGGACMLYILFVKVEERRQKYLGLLLPVAYFLYVDLSPSWWNWAIGPAGMLAIVLIGWLYPTRNTDRGQI